MIITVTFEVDDNSTLEVLNKAFDKAGLEPQMLAMNADIFQEFFKANAQLKIINDLLEGEL